MASSALKLLAQKAKKRLSTAGQIGKKNNTKTTFAYLSQGKYAIVASKQKIEEDPLFEKVRKLTEKGDIINPLAELTDKELFKSLNELEKERYMIDISKRYNKIKDYFLTHVNN